MGVRKLKQYEFTCDGLHPDPEKGACAVSTRITAPSRALAREKFPDTEFLDKRISADYCKGDDGQWHIVPESIRLDDE